jgi:hypothetical protein
MKHLVVKVGVELLLNVVGADVLDLCPEWDSLLDYLLVWISFYR